MELERFDVLVVDLPRPGGGQLDLLRHARQCSPEARIILISSVSYHQELAEAFALGASDYLQRPVSPEDLSGSISRVMSADGAPNRAGPWEGLELTLHSEQRQAALEGIRALVRAVEARDPFTKRHSTQVAQYALHLARRLDVKGEALESIAVAALVHDVGKIGIPDAILTLPGRLTPEQFECVRRHSGLGEYIIRNLSVFDAEARIVRHHHENWDGSGYPDGLSREEIPLASRVIRVADTMDAMLMRRIYRRPYPVETMLEEFTRCAGRDFDPKLAHLTVAWCRLHPEALVVPSPDAAAALTPSA